MAFKDRINELISSLKISRAEFERRAGLSNGYTRNLGGVPGADKLESILRAFPEVSRVWLLTGEGDMLKNSTEAEVNSAPEVRPMSLDQIPSDMVSRLLALVENQQEIIAKQAAVIAENTAVLKSVKEELAGLNMTYEKSVQGSSSLLQDARSGVNLPV